MRKARFTFAVFISFALSTFSQGTEKLRVAVSPWYFPVIFESETGEIQGVDHDVANAIASRLGYEVELKVMPREKIGAAVAAGDVDFGLSAIELHSYLRSYAAAHVDPEKIALVEYYRVPAAFVVRDPAIQSTSDLAGKLIATLAYTEGRISLIDWVANGVIGKVFGYENDQVLVNTLKLNRVHGILVALPTALELAASSDGQWTSVPATAADGEQIREPLAIVLPAEPENSEKAEKIAAAIEEFRSSGDMVDIAARWLDNP